LRQQKYQETITLRLTRAARDYIVARAKIERITMTQFLRRILLAHWKQHAGLGHQS
jgi:uncharacterized protein (DUF1778 family)